MDRFLSLYRIIIAMYFCIGGLFLSNCNPTKNENSSIVLPRTDIRLEFRGKILDIPDKLQPPFQFRARAYSCPDWSENYSPRVALGEYPACMRTFVEKLQTFDSPNYEIDLDVPSNWSHAYIELLDLNSIQGRYSPGNNPNWFTYSVGEILTFRHDFRFRSQENPIPDHKQVELARKFAPILIMDSNKKEIPSNLEKYYGRVELDFFDSPKTPLGYLQTRYESEKTSYMILPDPESIPDYRYESDPIHIYYHVRYANTTVSGSQAESLPGYRDNQNYWYEEGDGRFVISYWLWFDRNYGPSPMGNYHQGDWESFSVLVDNNGYPQRILTTGHNAILVDTDWENINSLNHHPILYIASGRDSDGGNPISPYGNYEVYLSAGSPFLNRLADPRDRFPDPSSDVQVILPSDLSRKDLTEVLIGANTTSGKMIDFSGNPTRSIDRLVQWEEPGWINQPADQDPDGHHLVDSHIADFLKFTGTIGKHPISKIQYLNLTKYGSSPRNPPFKNNIEQHYTYERPRKLRIHRGRIGDYGPKFIGNSKTPQFTNRELSEVKKEYSKTRKIPQ